ncbi:helix-turn-helix domain-containing protein [Clostridium sp. WILCCON 0269]|uniref:Helix-turn-helix domain-containing protein n=1 Tax=Candidatus Clostridium eludens TaxID=3381663 RepID=A0ABW8SNZ9_9CLOT
MTMGATMLSKTLKRIQKENKLTCKQVAKMAGVSESAVVRYGLGDRNIPEDVITNLAKFSDFEELKMAYKAEKKLGIINIPLMNGIDDNIQCMILKMIQEEIPEAVEAFKEISSLTMNKKFLGESETEELYKHMEQVADLIPPIETFLIRLKKIFGVSLDRLDMTECEKFRQKHYIVDIEEG